MKIRLFGAAGAGAATLGTALGAPHFNGEGYCWGPLPCRLASR